MGNQTERVNKVIKIDKAIANKLIGAYRPDYKVQSIERFTGGKSTSNYKVTIAGSKRPIVLRIYPQSNSTGDKEFAINKKMKELVPIPTMHYFDSSKKLIEHSYAIMEYLDGITLDEYISKHNHFPESLAEEIGEKLALIHHFEYDQEGFLDSNLKLMEGLPPIQLWYKYFMNGTAGKRLDDTTMEKMIQFEERFNSLITTITERFVFNHGDFRPENLMVKDDRLIGIMDWEFSLSAPCFSDIGQFLRVEELVDSNIQCRFIKGYNRNAKRPLNENWKGYGKAIDMMNMFSMLDSKEERPMLYSSLKERIDKSFDFLGSQTE